jgi:hypothetical protein
MRRMFNEEKTTCKASKSAFRSIWSTKFTHVSNTVGKLMGCQTCIRLRAQRQQSLTGAPDALGIMAWNALCEHERDHTAERVAYHWGSIGHHPPPHSVYYIHTKLVYLYINIYIYSYVYKFIYSLVSRVKTYDAWFDPNKHGPRLHPWLDTTNHTQSLTIFGSKKCPSGPTLVSLSSLIILRGLLA